MSLSFSLCCFMRIMIDWLLIKVRPFSVFGHDPVAAPLFLTWQLIREFLSQYSLDSSEAAR